MKKIWLMIISIFQFLSFSFPTVSAEKDPVSEIIELMQVSHLEHSNIEVFGYYELGSDFGEGYKKDVYYEVKGKLNIEGNKTKGSITFGTLLDDQIIEYDVYLKENIGYFYDTTLKKWVKQEDETYSKQIQLIYNEVQKNGMKVFLNNLMPFIKWDSIQQNNWKVTENKEQFIIEPKSIQDKKETFNTLIHLVDIDKVMPVLEEQIGEKALDFLFNDSSLEHLIKEIKSVRLMIDKSTYFPKVLDIEFEMNPKEFFNVLLSIQNMTVDQNELNRLPEKATVRLFVSLSTSERLSIEIPEDILEQASDYYQEWKKKLNE